MVHVDFVPSLGKRTDDERIVQYFIDSDRAILTSDDDFLTDFEPADYAALLLIEDESLRPVTVADIVHEIGLTLDGPARELFYVSRNWL